MAEYEHENRAEEDRCIQAYKDIIKQRRDNRQDVAAIIIEPISAFENHIATPYFYRQVRRIAKENGIPFIVDETKTGVGSTGKFWALEHWNLEDAADLVTFGQRSGISGFFSTHEYRLIEGPDSICFQQNADIVKLLNFGITWKYI